MSSLRSIAAIAVTTFLLNLPAVAQSLDTAQEHPELGAFFADVGTAGTFVAVNVHTGAAHVFNPERATQPFPPASTFKIFNSLIALETGVVRDPDTHVLKWDGEVRNNAAWNMDHSLRSAFQVSALPVYRGIARQVGLERMTGYLSQVPYVSGDVTARTLDIFWVLSSYTTTALKQVEFLRRLYLNDLPFSQSVMDAVKDIAVVEHGVGYVLAGKTGYTTDVTPGAGWFIGWVEREDGAYVFALNLDVHDRSHVDARVDIARQSLQALNLLP